MNDESGWDDVIGPQDPVADVTPPLTITGILRDAAKPKPLQGASLSLLMSDQEMADAGITPAGQTAQTGPMVAAAYGRAYDGLCRLPDGSVYPYTDAGGGYVDLHGGGNPDTTGHAGIGAAADGTSAPTSPKRGGLGGGGPSGNATSPASRAGRSITGSTRLDGLKPITKAIGPSATTSVGGAISRAIPFLAVPSMLNDLYQHDTAPDCVPVPDPTVIY